jgi:hypothetical protein
MLESVKVAFATQYGPSSSCPPPTASSLRHVDAGLAVTEKQQWEWEWQQWQRE